jgi:hypothetical protein
LALLDWECCFEEERERSANFERKGRVQWAFPVLTVYRWKQHCFSYSNQWIAKPRKRREFGNFRKDERKKKRGKEEKVLTRALK